jgi:hypothetical protein
MRGQEKSRSYLVPRRRGGLFNSPIIGGLNKPPRPLQLRMLREMFIDVAATPPRLMRGVRHRPAVGQQPLTKAKN